MMSTVEAKMVIHPVHMDVDTCYLVGDQDIVLVDAGHQGLGSKMRTKLDELCISPSQIRLIFLTHGHWDHIGALGELKQFISCPVAIHYKEKEWVEKGLKPMPPALNLWGRFIQKLIDIFYVPKLTFGGVPIDITLGDEPFSLAEFGIRGSIYPTPGHSSGSTSLVLESGEAFVGDLATSALYFRLRPGMTVFAEQPSLISASWRLLREAGARMIYPAHGRPFDVKYLNG